MLAFFEGQVQLEAGQKRFSIAFPPGPSEAGAYDVEEGAEVSRKALAHAGQGQMLRR